MPAEDSSDGEKPATTSGTRLVERAAAAADAQAGQVLMQRVIALTGVVDTVAEKPARQPVILGPIEIPKAVHNPPVDLSATSLEWGGRPIGAKAPAPSKPAPAPESNDFVDAQWATHSSIALELCDDAPFAQRMLSMNIEDAVTQQYNPNVATRVLPPAAAEPERDSKLRQAQRAPEPPRAARMLVVPAALAWTVGGAFSLCALALVYLVTAFLACGHPSLLDPIGMRCVDRADVAKAR
jgi:hypothetical protein